MNNSIAVSSENKKEKLIETWQLYLIISALTIILSFAFQKFILTKDVYYSIYGDQLEFDRIDQIFDLTKKFQIWSYIFTPLVIWLRIAFVAFLIQLPMMIKFIEIPFKEIFRIVAFAFLALLAIDLVKFVYLLLLPNSSITANTISFMPLAITNFLPSENYSAIVYSILSKFNLFEFLWIFIVYKGLSKTGKIDKLSALIYSLSIWVSIIILSVAISLFVSSL